MLGLAAGIAVVGEARDGEEAVTMSASLSPDVILMDLRMPRCDGIEATRLICAAGETQVIALTTVADDDSIMSVLEAGARGYLTKDCGMTEIKRAIEVVHAGQSLLDPAVQDRLIRRARGAPTASGPDALTEREGQVLRLIAEGLDNREIAQRLFITEATVKTHINNVFSKIGARDRAQAVTYAYRTGFARA
ncbi:MAG: response regulator transcription factor [Actinomycetota bacterium]|nr:response regulator transcription factor [Actinomycetota bacterium]